MIEIKQENASLLRNQLYESLTKAPNVTNVEWVNEDKYGFSRTLVFVVSGKMFKIYWMWNLSQLYFENDAFLNFDTLKVKGTWPNAYKNNLQFEYRGETVAVIPIEEYREGE